MINTDMTVAYKCSSCGTFEFFDVSFFKLLDKKEYCHKCRCSKSMVIIEENKPGKYLIKIPCIGCGKKHVFFFKRRDILYKRNSVKIFNCPETGVYCCVIGKGDKVRSEIDSLEKELDEMINKFGYDSYFKNTQVMFDILNILHDIAEQDNLYCECGNNDVELILLSDRINLRCKKCSGSKDIYASTNEDLKDILHKQKVLLISKTPRVL